MNKAITWIFVLFAVHGLGLVAAHFLAPEKDITPLATAAAGSITGSVLTLCLFRMEMFKDAE